MLSSWLGARGSWSTGNCLLSFNPLKCIDISHRTEACHSHDRGEPGNRPCSRRETKRAFRTAVFRLPSSDFHPLQAFTGNIFEKVLRTRVPDEFGPLENVEIAGVLAAPFALAG